ncbi:MAG: hypothetical protein JO218_02480, partial [Burkholderiales bacterium]|nr:hypothetical protein [Burkholderiales bacterium]
MRSNLPRLVATVLLIAMALSASADHLVVGVEATDQFPIYRASETESYTGYARELLDSFAAAYGHVLEYRAMPIPRLYA